MKNVLKLTLVFFFFVALSLIYTAPLVNHLEDGFAYTAMPTEGNEVVPFQQGDAVQLYYHFWMAWDYFQGGPGPFFQDPYEFKMGEGSEGVFTTRRLLISLLFLLFTPFGTVFAFNALILLCVALSGFMAFLLARHYTNQIFPSLVAGFIYGFFPFALAQILGGHTNGFVLFLVPFMLWCFEKGISTNRITYFLLSSIGFVCFALIEYHLLYYLCLMTPFFFFFRMAFVRPGWRSFFRLGFALLFAGVAGGLVMLLIKTFEIEGSLRAGGVSLREISLYSPSWRHLFFRLDGSMEKMVYLGFLPLVASLFSFLIFGLRKPLFWLYAGLLGFFGLLCLGPTLKLPFFRFLYDHLPYFSLSRLPGRMVVFVALAVGILIALALARMRKGQIIALILLLVMGFDYFPRSAVGITLLPPQSKVYEFVKENIGEKNLLCLPVWPGDTSWSSVYLYYVTQTKVPIVNGYYPIVPENYVENVFYPLYSMNVGEVRPEQLTLLKKLDVKYVVFHEEAFPGKVSHFPARITLAHLQNSPYLRLVMQDQKHWLFEFLETPEERAQKISQTSVGIYLMGRKLRRGKGLWVDHRIQILPAGKYVARFRFKGEGTRGIPIKVLGNDPVKRKDRRYIDHEVLAEALGQPGEVTLPFTLDKAQLVTFQVEKPANKKAQIESILVTQFGVGEFPTLLEAEALFTHGIIVVDKEASSRMAVLGTPSAVAQTELLYGPYRLYPKGEYVVRFWVKPTQALGPVMCADTYLARLEVVTDYGRRPLARRPLLASDLYSEEGYHPVELSFSLKEDEVLEFRVPFLRKAGFYIDKLEVEKL